jgi:hypothetical protein
VKLGLKPFDAPERELKMKKLFASLALGLTLCFGGAAFAQTAPAAAPAATEAKAEVKPAAATLHRQQHLPLHPPPQQKLPQCLCLTKVIQLG